MNPEIPEEFKTMAALLGESAAIDSLMVNNPTTLATNTSTIKRGISEYQEQRKREQMAPPQNPTHYYGEQSITPVSIPNYVPPIDLPYTPQREKVDDGQLEFNLEPTKADEIIILLKEISTKLTTQNKLLDKIYVNQSKEKGIPIPPIKLVSNK